MKKLNSAEIAFIKGVYKANVQQSHWVFWFSSKDSELELISKYNQEKDKIKKQIRELESSRYNVLNAVDREKGKIKKVFDEQINSLKKKIDDSFYQRHILSTGIYFWFEKNLIVHVKRPETLWNKWDYWFNDENLEKFVSNNPYFVKFDSLEEYNIYDELLDSSFKKEYTKWFEKNEKSFTMICLEDKEEKESTNNLEEVPVFKILANKLKNFTLRFDSFDYREKSWEIKSFFEKIWFHNSMGWHDWSFWFEKKTNYGKELIKQDDLYSLSFRNTNKPCDIEKIKKQIVAEWLEDNVWFGGNNEENDKIWKWFEKNIYSKLN